MSTASLWRLCGVPLLLGGLIGAVCQYLHPDTANNSLFVPLHLALFAAVMLVLLGLPALVARQIERSGPLGALGGACLFVGLACVDLLHSVLVFGMLPALASDPRTQG